MEPSIEDIMKEVTADAGRYEQFLFQLSKLRCRTPSGYQILPSGVKITLTQEANIQECQMAYAAAVQGIAWGMAPYTGVRGKK